MRKPIHAVGLIALQMLILYIPLAYIGAKYFEVKGVFAATLISYVVTGIVGLVVVKRVTNKLE
jgi:Na+-driven multidrug efflux pump